MRSNASRGWLFGPLPDLLFGCGLIYAGFFVAQTLAGPQMRGWISLEFQPLLALLLGAPHYGATLLRIFERPEDRHRYQTFAIAVSVAAAAAFVLGLHWHVFGSLLVTLYLSWSPWHYSGQNYGVAVMFLRRRGVAVTPGIRRPLHASFVLSFLLVLVGLHGVGSDALYSSAPEGGVAFRFVAIGVPFANQVFAGLAVAWAAVLGVAGARLLRVASPGQLLPTALLVLMQALWFAIPAIARRWGVFSDVEPFQKGEFQAYAFMWIASGHFLQYLWITCFYAAAGTQATARRHARFLAKAMLAGTAIWVVPKLLFAPGLLGRLPYDFGLALLTASVVNLHHFILDGAIWKMRDGPVARILLREVPETLPLPEAIGPGKRWGLRAAALAGVLLFLVALGANLEKLAYRRAVHSEDAARALSAVERLRSVGRESPLHQIRIARTKLRGGDAAGAQAALERSIRLHPTPRAWALLGRVHESTSANSPAEQAYRRALALDPGNADALFGAIRVVIRQGRDVDARALLGEALRLHPKDPRGPALRRELAGA